MRDQQQAVTEQPATRASTHGLHRALSVWGAAAFVVTSMVGTGIFTVPAFVRAATGDGLSALGVWVMGAVLALCGALCYAELATRMPEAGGEYQYLSRIYGPMWGFVSGWISFVVGFAAPTAASSLGAVAYAAATVPGWNPNAPLFEGGPGSGAVVAAILPLLFGVMHCFGVRPTGHLQSLLMTTTIGSIIVLVIAGFLSGRGDWSGVTQGSPGSGLFWVALIQVSFAYTGWNGATYLAGEIADPRRNLPRALIGGTLIVTMLYLALNLLFLYALPADAWQPNVAVGKDAAEHLFGPTGARIVSAIITVMIIGSISAWTASGPRVYYAMACDGLAPAIFKRLGRNRVPVFSVLLQAAVASLLALTGTYDALLTYVGSGLLLFSGCTVAAVYLVIRSDRADASAYFRVPGYPVTPAIFLVMVAISWVQSLQERPGPTGAALATLLVGFLTYFVFRGLGWLRGAPEPIAETSSD